MSTSSTLENDVESGSKRAIALLSQRDLGLTVPMNFVTQPGVSLTAACFPFGRYTDVEAATCISNLLNAGFRRFIVDLYWDSGRQQWSFCPVEIPTNFAGSGTPSSSSSQTSITSSSVSLSSVQLKVSKTSRTSATHHRNIKARTASDAAASSSTEAGAASTTEGISQNTFNAASSGAASSTVSSSAQPIATEGPAYQLGSYLCSTTMNLEMMTSFLSRYLSHTQDTIAAHLVILNLNIHAASPLESLGSPVPNPPASSLPQNSNFISNALQANLSAFLYTPSDLQHDRADLEDSWYAAPSSLRPDESYQQVQVSSNGIHTTIDGWPSEGYIEMLHLKRLLVSWGQLDPEMSGYNFAADEGTIFPQDELEVSHTIEVSNSDVLTVGCVFDPSTTALSQLNNSWFITNGIVTPNDPLAVTATLNHSLSLIPNITACGISPILNNTLLNSTANTNVSPYEDFAYEATWSWAPNEPRNSSEVVNDDSDDDGSNFRCAVADPTLNGRWRVEDCEEHNYAACRVESQPYHWQITTYATTFSWATGACPKNSTFDAPRTGLENLYLLSAIRKQTDLEGRSVWVKFNSLDKEYCWVVGGSNTTCPYVSDSFVNRERTVLVPSIGAIVVLFISALTLFVKCASNRRTSHRRRKSDSGWDYEGVPS
ncbi:hypothetical protein L228DRAFT_282165 [Xylona heveae TC161]|uniref:Maintenance of telomere capping protein 6 n=1 Tax=Xylona heveae (strain CBS 132557 / TC161) TaxID=1328760 RepID=A0A165HFK1_XYLHT|nr:hypothetical protein L228DRAFT_282165 [Xylona heveae TC161]KZF23436.1 hypothetical protein L228DRAFT_282165 [Xylona heveae TC161]